MASRTTGPYDGMIARVLLTPFKVGIALVLLLAGLLLVAWTIDWIYVDYVWPGRVEGLRDLLAKEMAVAKGLAIRRGGSAASVSAPAEWLYALVFETTGLHEMGNRFAGHEGLSIPDTVVRDAWIAHRETTELAMMSTQLLGLRAGILLRLLPLLFLLYGVGAAEGCSQRTTRRAEIARESASLYHRAKLGILVMLALGTAAVLVWPNPVAWSLCASFGGLGVAALSAEHLKYYKKHI